MFWSNVPLLDTQVVDLFLKKKKLTKNDKIDKSWLKTGVCFHQNVFLKDSLIVLFK